MARKSDPVEGALEEITKAFMATGLSREDAAVKAEEVRRVLDEHACKAERGRLLNNNGLAEEVCDAIRGLSVSVDVGWQGDPNYLSNGAGYRIFGEVSEVMGRERDSLTLLVYDSEANFPTSKPGDTLILNWLLSGIQPDAQGSYALTEAMRKKLMKLKGQSACDAVIAALPVEIRRQMAS